MQSQLAATPRTLEKRLHPQLAKWFRENFSSFAHAQLLCVPAVLERQSTEDFECPYKAFFEAAEGEAATQPVLVAVAANTYDHYEEHIGWIKQMRAKPAQR